MDLFSNSRTFQLLESALDAASLRQKTIAQNVANINTPGFKRSEVVFEEKLQEILGKKHRINLVRTHPRHMPLNDERNIEPEIKEDRHTSITRDGNNVDWEREMVQLAANSLYYSTASLLVGRKFSGMQRIISSGGR